MRLYELIATAIALSMDAFAVSVCKGLSIKKIKPRHAVITGLYFGGFQALMPLIGYYLGVSFRNLIESFDHWIAFFLLLILGINMIREATSDEEENITDCFSPRSMIPLSVATSIDALAVGVTFAFLEVKIISAVSIIGITTFAISALGVVIGKFVGGKFKSSAEVLGGIILILIGVKILLEHLGFINF